VEPYRERIEDFIRRWRSRYEGNRVFRVLVITVVLAALGVSWASYLQTPKYEASAKMWADWKQGEYWANLGGSGEEMQTLEYRELAPTMILAIDSRPVAEETIRRLELEMTPAELLYKLTVEQVANSNFIVLTYQSNDPVEATKIVNTVGKVVAEIASHRRSDVTATVWEKAKVPESPIISPHPLRNGLFTLIIGLGLCGGLALPHPLAARATGILSERVRVVSQGVGLAGVLRRQRRDRSIIERVKEKKLLLALGRRGKLTAVEAALETSLSVEEAERMLSDLVYQGHLRFDIEGGAYVYSFWKADERGGSLGAHP
jgi:capsular polysaccharide biosynthesis protein